MLRRASRAGLFLAKSRLRNLCENLLGEDHSLTRSLFPPPVDRIKQQAQVRAQLHTSLKNLAASARNHSATHSLEKGPGPSGDVSEWTLEHVKSGELTTTQLMQLARLRFTGSTHSHTHSPTPSDTPSDTTPAHSHTHSRDPELAVAAWVQASKQGDTHAAYSVAFCLLNGIGIARDEQEAFALMHPLAHSYDNAYAHYALGNMYLKGLGTDIDEKMAFTHYKEAARQGVPPAMYNLGNMFAAGVGVAQSDESAMACYEGAAGYGDVQAKYLQGSWLCAGRGTVKKDCARGTALLVEAATAGHARACYSLGVMYLEGVSEGDSNSGSSEESVVVKIDLAAAAVWFEKASGLGMCEASFNLGMLHMQGTEGSSDGVGKGVARDLQRARECFLLGMQQNEKNDACAVLLKEVDALIAQEKQSSVVTSDASSTVKTE